MVEKSAKLLLPIIESACAASRRFMFFFCGRGKVGEGNDRLISDESFETCMTEQSCSIPLNLLYCFVLLIVRPLGC